MEEKICPGCTLPFPLEVFGLIKKRGVMKPQSRCPPCRRLQSKADFRKHHEKRISDNNRRYHENSDARRARMRKYHSEHLVEAQEYRKGHRNENTYKSWVSRLKKKGLTPDDYARMLEAQGGRCAICRADKPGQKDNSSWAVDHCHTTGKVRGLLCHSCNLALGLLGDTLERLETATGYLRAALV